jgi:hypothetical protein
MTPLRGRRRAQISGRAFQTSVGLFFGFAGGWLSDFEPARIGACPGAGAVSVDGDGIPFLVSWKNAIFVGCGELNFDYTPEERVCVE